MRGSKPSERKTSCLRPGTERSILARSPRKSISFSTSARTVSWCCVIELPMIAARWSSAIAARPLFPPPCSETSAAQALRPGARSLGGLRHRAPDDRCEVVVRHRGAAAFPALVLGDFDGDAGAAEVQRVVRAGLHRIRNRVGDELAVRRERGEEAEAAAVDRADADEVARLDRFRD